MKHRLRLWHLALGGAALLLVGVVVGVAVQGRASLSNPENIEPNADVLYDRDYASIDEMMMESGAVIVLGVSGKSASSVRVGDGVLFTDRTVTISEVLRGDLATPGQSVVTVRQTGGADSEGHLAIDGQRLLGSGESVMLALVYDSFHRRYWIIGGAHGYFQIVNGSLIHANLGSSDHDLAARWDDGQHPLATFANSTEVAELRTAVSGGG